MRRLKNTSPDTPDDTWTIDGATYTEAIRQEYGENDCVYSAGMVENLPPEDVYFCLKKENNPDLTIFVAMRADEMQALAYLLSGALWSHLMAIKFPEDEKAEHETVATPAL